MWGICADGNGIADVDESGDKMLKEEKQFLL